MRFVSENPLRVWVPSFLRGDPVSGESEILVGTSAFETVLEVSSEVSPNMLSLSMSGVSAFDYELWGGLEAGNPVLFLSGSASSESGAYMVRNYLPEILFYTLKAKAIGAPVTIFSKIQSHYGVEFP